MREFNAMVLFGLIGSWGTVSFVVGPESYSQKNVGGTMVQSAMASRTTGAKLMRFFLNKGGGSSAPSAIALPAENNSSSSNEIEEARRDLLNQVGDFIIQNRLDITPANLLRSLAICSGTDSELARKVTEREIKGEVIDQRWLDREAPSQGAHSNAQPEIDRLFTKLESSIESFSATARDARSAASDYRGELSKHSLAISNVTAPDDMVAQLAKLATAMLERTLKVEDDMKRSEREVSTLRSSLQRAQRDAEIDHLTGLPNRRAFEAVFEAQYREAQREIEPLSVAFCDIDHFKRVNDTHGHDTGDRVIQAIAQALAQISDDRCHVARHGGEEFVMLFRGLNTAEAKARLDGVRETMASRNFINRTSDTPIGSITFSGGIANVFGYGNPRDALSAADKALYRAKAEGRNRIELA